MQPVYVTASLEGEAEVGNHLPAFSPAGLTEAAKVSESAKADIAEAEAVADEAVDVSALHQTICPAVICLRAAIQLFKKVFSVESLAVLYCRVATGLQVVIKRQKTVFFFLATAGIDPETSA